MQQDTPPAGAPGSIPSSKIQWELVKHQKYNNGSLSQVSCLYTIKVYCTEGVFTFGTEPIRSIILRINPSIDCVLLNKAVSIEVLDGIAFNKFTSKKKNYISRLQDLAKHFENNLHIVLPESLKESFIGEFEDAAKLLKSSFSM